MPPKTNYSMTIFNEIPAYWWAFDNNFGDEINPFLISKITGVNCFLDETRQGEHLLAIGSVLGFANNKSVVWGSGFINERSVFLIPPKAINAVRGKLTLSVLNKLDFHYKVPLGDPALLMPKYYLPIIHKKYKYGVIPHFVDRASGFISKQYCRDDTLVINVQKNIFKVIDEILSCEVVYSSSLHGVVIADAYGVEAHRIKIGNKIIGGDFKFNDYASAINRHMNNSMIVDDGTTIEQLDLKRINYNFTINTDDLLDSFPMKVISQ